MGGRRREGGRVEEETVEGRKTFRQMERTAETWFRVGVESRIVGEMGTLDVRPAGGEDASFVLGFVEAGGPGWFPHGF